MIFSLQHLLNSLFIIGSASIYTQNLMIIIYANLLSINNFVLFINRLQIQNSLYNIISFMKDNLSFAQQALKILTNDSHNKKAWNDIIRFLKCQTKNPEEIQKKMMIFSRLEQLQYKHPQYAALHNYFKQENKQREKGKQKNKTIESIPHNPPNLIQLPWIKQVNEYFRLEPSANLQELLIAIAKKTYNPYLLGQYKMLEQPPFQFNLKTQIRRLISVRDIHGKITYPRLNVFSILLNREIKCQQIKFLELSVVEFMNEFKKQGQSFFKKLQFQIKHIHQKQQKCKSLHLNYLIKIYELKIKILSQSPSTLTKQLDQVLGKINEFYGLDNYQFTRTLALLLSIDIPKKK